MCRQTIKIVKNTAYNRRFGTMAGVTPQNVSWEIDCLYPARPIVSPATAPSRHHVVSNAAKVVADNLVKSSADSPLFDKEWRKEKIWSGSTLFEVFGSGQSFVDF